VKTQITDRVNLDTLPLRSRSEFDLTLARLADGSSLTVPVHVVVGTRTRPRLVALAGIHGDESEGMLSLLDFWADCDPAELDGAVVLVPVANPPAFAAHQRRSPLDGLDLNRTFPGKRDGTPSERLAYRLLHDLVAGADFAFTLHSWSATGTVVTYVEFPVGDGPVMTRSFEAAKAAGFCRLRQSGWFAGALGPAAIALGVPAIEAEIGGHGMSTAANRAAYVDHLHRLLQHVGIRRGAPPPNAAAAVYSKVDLYAPSGGMLRVLVQPGELVERDALLATISDLHGGPVAEMRAPHAGMVAAMRCFVSVNPGDHVFAFFRPVGASSSDGAS
jgi:predicted deacylase